MNENNYLMSIIIIEFKNKQIEEIKGVMHIKFHDNKMFVNGNEQKEFKMSDIKSFMIV